MSEIEVAEGTTPLNLRYNMQSSNPSAYQKRVTSYLYPTQNGIVTDKSSRTIRFLVGSNFFLDGRNSYLRLQAKIDGGIGDPAVTPGLYVNSVNTSGSLPTLVAPWNHAIFTSYTETWIKSLTLYTNMGVVIEQIRDYNILGAIMKANIEPEYAQSVGFESLNIVDSAVNDLSVLDRSIMASQFKTYVIEMRGSGFLKAFNYLPLKALAGQNSNSLQIEIEFAELSDMVIAWQSTAGEGQTPEIPTNYSLQSSASQPTPNSALANLGYTLQNIVLVQSLLQDDLMEASLMDTIKSVPLMIHYDTFRHYTNKIPANSSGNYTLSVSEYQESVKSLTSTSRYANAKIQTVDTTSFMNPNLQQYQLQIGPVYFPSQPILMSVGGTGDVPDLGEQYYEYTKENQKAMFYNKGFQPSGSFFVKGANGNFYVQSQKDNAQFILTNDLRPFPDYAIGDPEYHEYISGYNTKSSPQPLQLILQNAAQKTIPVTMGNSDVIVDSFTNYDSYCVIQSNEVYIIS